MLFDFDINISVTLNEFMLAFNILTYDYSYIYVKITVVPISPDIDIV